MVNKNLKKSLSCRKSLVWTQDLKMLLLFSQPVYIFEWDIIDSRDVFSLNIFMIFQLTSYSFIIIFALFFTLNANLYYVLTFFNLE